MELYDPTFQSKSCDGDVVKLDCTDFLSGISIVFDGEFYVARIPAGFKLYTGTTAQDQMLYHSFSRHKFNIGLNPDDFKSTGPSWFGSLPVAKSYAKDKDCKRCVYSFIVKKTCDIIVLSNVYNLVKLALTSSRHSVDHPTELYEMYENLELFVNIITLNRDTSNLNWLTPELVKNKLESTTLSDDEVEVHKKYITKLLQTYKNNVDIPAYEKDKKIVYDTFMYLNGEWHWKPDSHSPYKKDFPKIRGSGDTTLIIKQVFEYIVKRMTAGTLTLPNNDDVFNQLLIEDGKSYRFYKPNYKIYRYLSDNTNDIMFSERLREYLLKVNLKYCGYMTPRVRLMRYKQAFHEEVMFFNPYQILKRDFSDQEDAYNDRKPTLQGPILQRFIKRYSYNTRAELGGSLWAHTVWSLLYTEKILEYYQTPLYLNLNSEDSKFIAFVSLVHELSNDDITIRELADELGVYLDYKRLKTIHLVQSQYTEFNKIVEKVSADPTQYFSMKSNEIVDISLPHCDDYNYLSSKWCSKYIMSDDKYAFGFMSTTFNLPTQKLVAILREYVAGLTPLQIASLVIVSMAHVVGMVPYGINIPPDLKHEMTHLIVNSKNFPISNQYQTEHGSKNKSKIMKKVGIAIAQVIFTNKLV